jgi:hypothetical protein
VNWNGAIFYHQFSFQQQKKISFVLNVSDDALKPEHLVVAHENRI